MFATYLFGGDGGPINLSYSADGGKTWATGALNADKDQRASSVDSAVNGHGQGWVAWLDNGSVLAQSFQAADAVTPAVASSSASSNGQTVTVGITCASYPCTVSVTLTAPETVVIHAASVPRKKTKASKTLKLASGKFTLKSIRNKQLAIKLTGAAKRLLKNKTGRIKVTASIATVLERHTTLSTKTLTLTLKPAKKAKRK